MEEYINRKSLIEIWCMNEAQIKDDCKNIGELFATIKDKEYLKVSDF